MNLSHFDRVLLANQYKILRLSEPSNSDYYDQLIEALEKGYESSYTDLIERSVYSDKLSEEECEFVVEAMALHLAMQDSYKNLDDKEDIDHSKLKFMGFDGNNEGKHMSYAQFVRERERRFEQLELGSDGFNSHMPTIPLYRNRIDFWKLLPPEKQSDLTAADIRAILEVKVN